ncbi:MAG: Cna B-type domain-containing protein [Clostridia bacterium]|nr:Cna B-type domain-containing protein [Clostridia bacterium]
MKVTLKRIFALLLCATLLFGLATNCFAANTKGKLTVELNDKDQNKISNMTVNICQVATLSQNGYSPVAAFENSGISVSGIVNNPSEAAAKTIADYVKSNNISALSAISDGSGAVFGDLDLGIWLVFTNENEQYTFNPYLVFLPSRSGDKLLYQLTSSPKLQDNTPNEISLYVIKKWDDKNNASKNRPESVTIELLNGDTVVSSVQLSEQNGWSHTFEKLSKDGNYSVREKAVANYKTTYSGDTTNGFIVTNTYNGEKLPQTGQYWWPIVLIAVAGAGFVALGIYELGVKKNGKEE